MSCATPICPVPPQYEVLGKAAALLGYAEALLDLLWAAMQWHEHTACWLPPLQAKVLTLKAAYSW